MNKQNNLGRFILVLVIIAWALMEIYPPTSRDLVQEFSRRAQNRDTAFTDIVKEARQLQSAGTNEFAALQFATSTNDLQKYFPFIASAKNQIHPNLYILNRLQRDAAGKIKLGLDLQGGTSFLVEMDTSKVSDTNQTSGALSQAIEVLRHRIDKFGVAEPTIQAAGNNRILIQLPGLSQSDKDSARQQITNSAYLEFRMVNDRSHEIVDEQTGELREPVPPGYVLLKHNEQRPDGKSVFEAVVVSKKPVNGLAGDIVKRAGVSRDNLGNPEITFEMTVDGAKRFGEVTRDNIGHRMAVVLDGELHSAPVIQAAIENGNVQITGNFTPEAAYSLANVLENPLRAQRQSC